MKKWLRLISILYWFGDQSVKGEDISRFRKKLKYLPKFIENNKADTKVLDELTNKFFALGQYINSRHTNIRIEISFVNAITEYIDVEKLSWRHTFIRIFDRRLYLVLFCICLSAFVTGGIYYFINDDKFSLMIGVMLFPISFTIIKYLKGD